jgi:hypothetical protein
MPAAGILIRALEALLLAVTAHADVRLVAQAGANQGLLAAGIAGDYAAATWAVTAGATPSSDGKGAIHQLNLEVAASVHDGDDFRLLLGPAVLINASDETFFELPDKYPRDYYPPNAYFFALQTTLLTRSGFFVEASILQYYLEVLAQNPRGSVSNAELVSLGVGKVY